jgi:hypothetical protein
MSAGLVNRLRRSYLSRNEADDFAWLTNLVRQLPGVADALGVADRLPELQQAYQVYAAAIRYQQAAKTIFNERTGDKEQAGWNPPGTPVTIRPGQTPTGPAAPEQATAGAYTIAVGICDELLANRNGKCDQAMRELLHLNPRPKKSDAGTRPRFTAGIKRGRLTVDIVKGGFRYFLVKVDHGGGVFDRDYVVLESPLVDDTPLPEAAPQLWRVQVTGYRKGDSTGLPGDIIDVAAKTGTAEYAEETA